MTSQPRFDIRQLVYATALARAGSFVRASEELGIAQSSLSRAIQAMERRIGAPLFDRLPRKVVPTALGELVIREGAPVLASARDLDQEISATLGLETGRLRVLFGPYPAATILGRALGHLLETAPGITVEVDEADTGRIEEIVLRGEVDIAVVELSLFPGLEGLKVQPLRVRTGVYACRAGHPLLAKGSVSFEDLMAYPLVTSHISPTAWRRFAAGTSLVARGEELAESGSAVRCQSLLAMADLAECSDAVALLGRHIIEHRIAAGRMAVLPVTFDEPTSNWGIILREGRTPSRAAAAFIEAILFADAEIPDGIESAAE